jgi:hypothetical protein
MLCEVPHESEALPESPAIRVGVSEEILETTGLKPV